MQEFMKSFAMKIELMFREELNKVDRLVSQN